jgi:hypothetical protein
MRRRQPQKIICDNCGKEGLEYRAFAYWSVKEQKFVVDDIDWDYEPWCPECQCDVEVSEVRLTPQEVIEMGLMEFDDDT